MKTFKSYLLKLLKDRGLSHLIPKIKSVKTERYSGGSSATVACIDLTKPERETLRSVVDEFQQGDFDGMTDSYNLRESKVTHQFSYKYTFVNNEMSHSKRAGLIKVLLEQYSVTDDESSQRVLNCWYDQAIHRLFTSN